MMKANLQESISNFLPKQLKSIDEILSIQAVSGGDINDAYRLETGSGFLFIKLNRKENSDFFVKEALGLDLLRKNSNFRIPEVIGFGSFDAYSYLALEWIDQSTKNPSDSILGQQLAKMHKCSNSVFGLEDNNYIGSLDQVNKPMENWQEFFVLNRLEPQFRMAFDKGCFNAQEQRSFEKFCIKLNDLIPVEKPALIHGDLWSGNYLIDSNQDAVLIDPAVSFSHREMDIAMMHLFGGFSNKVFDDYNAEHPLESGWEERLSIHNLYPVLVHVNLFQGGYIGQASATIANYV